MVGCSIPKERYIKIYSYYCPLFRRKICYLQDVTIKYFKDFLFYKHTLQEKNILMVLNADHKRYKNYIWLHIVIILPMLPISKAVEKFSTIWDYNSNKLIMFNVEQLIK